MKHTHLITSIKTIATAACLAATPAFAHEGEDHGSKSKEVTVTGEVVDLTCYVDHSATGEKHADCAQKCIQMGLPAGLKASDGQTYMLIGEHKPINEKLAPLAGKTITVKGKESARDGVKMIENVEIVKQ